MTGRAESRVEGRNERLIGRALRAYAVAAYLFLFVPIVVVVVFSFNAGRHVAELTGFSLRWYEAAWTDPFVLGALRTSLSIAAATAVLATLLGTMAALGIESSRRLGRVFDQLTYIAIIVPGIVIGIASLLFLVSLYGWLNPWLEYLFGPDAPHLGLGAHSIVATHTVFTTAIVTVLVRTRLRGMDRSLTEASEDLYATPWGTFRQVTLPQLLPAVVAAALLAFTFSFDDFIVAFFTSGKDQTLPIYLFASIRRGVTPQVNAIATVLLAVTITAMAVVGLLLVRRSGGAPRGAADDTAVAETPTADPTSAPVPAGEARR
jgi:spermidine/putrescine transport system permease protein